MTTGGPAIDLSASAPRARLNVLVLSRNFPNAALPRLGLWVEGLVRHSAAWRSTVVSPVPYCPPVPFLSENYTRFRHVPPRTQIGEVEVSYPRVLTPPGGRLRALEGHAYLAGVHAEVARIWERAPFDAIHAHFTYPDGWAAVQLGRQFGVPVIITEHASWRSWFGTSPIVRTMALEALSGCVFHVSVGSALRREMADLTGENAKLRVIPCGVDGATFHRRSDGVAMKSRQILFVGAVRRVKGLDVLLRALRCLVQRGREETLVVAGDTFFEEYRATLRHAEQMVASLGLQDRVRFLGGQEPAAVARLMQESAVLVLPSRRETLGMVLVEALACGTPIVATDCGGPSDIVTNEVGVLVPPDEPDTMARAIAHVIDHPGRYNPDRLRAHALGKFAWPRITTQYLELFECAAASNRERVLS